VVAVALSVQGAQRTKPMPIIPQAVISSGEAVAAPVPVLQPAADEEMPIAVLEVVEPPFLEPALIEVLPADEPFPAPPPLPPLRPSHRGREGRAVGRKPPSMRSPG